MKNPKEQNTAIRSVLDKLRTRLGRPLLPMEMTAAIRKAKVFPEEEEGKIWHRATWPKVKRVLTVTGPDEVPYWDHLSVPDDDGEEGGWQPTPLFDLDGYREVINSNVRSVGADLGRVRKKIRYFERHFDEHYTPPAGVNLSLDLQDDETDGEV
jgi:hypothetical protein